MATELAVELNGGEAGIVDGPRRSSPGQRIWSWLWPKLAAIGLALAAWQIVVWTGWKPDYVLPGPWPVMQRLAQDLSQPDFYAGVATTMRRAVVGYAIAVVLGSVVGLLVARVTILRKAVGAAILGSSRCRRSRGSRSRFCC